MISNLKVFLGRAFAIIFPNKRKRIQQGFTQPYWGNHISQTKLGRFIERLMRYYIAHSDHGKTGGEKLESMHTDFWSRQIKHSWFDGTDAKFEQSLFFLEKPLSALERFLASADISTICEIGTGDGRFLQHLSKRFPFVPRFIGLDLATHRIEFNKSLYEDLEFYAVDAREWLKDQRLGRTLYVTNGGVLEYFSPDSLQAFAGGVKQFGGAIALFYEPIAPSHNLSKGPRAKLTTAGEFSFSHNYPAVFGQLGFKVSDLSDDNSAGYRGLCLIADSV